MLVRRERHDTRDDVDTRYRPPDPSDDRQQHNNSEKHRCHTTCDQIHGARLRPSRRSLYAAHSIVGFCCAKATSLIGAKRIGDELPVGRASTSGWESRDVNEHRFAAVEWRDKAEPAKVVPFDDFPFDSHVQ